VAQYPLEMGRKKRTSNALAVQVDAEGKIKYDAIARQGQNKDKLILYIFSESHLERTFSLCFLLVSGRVQQIHRHAS